MLNETEHTFPEYVAYQAGLAKTVFSVPNLKTAADFIDEYELIKNKKSKLSSNNRRIVEHIVLSAKDNYEADKQNGNYNRFEKCATL